MNARRVVLSKGLVGGAVLITSTAVGSVVAPTETATILGAIDDVFDAGLSASLAGLSLAAASFLLVLSGLQRERRDHLILGGMKEKSPIVVAVDEQLKNLASTGTSLIAAFFAFILSLILTIAITDGVLAYSSSLAAKVADAGLSACPFFLGLDYLYDGALGIKAGFLKSIEPPD